MTLASYQIFKTVAEIGSFHKAADVLGLTPSAYKKTTGGAPGKDEKGSALVEALKALS